MIILVLIVIAVVAFFMWSANGAKSAKRRYLYAHNNALVERFQNRESEPTWWDSRDPTHRSAVKSAVAPLAARTPLSPAAVQLWLNADETWEDFLTFMAHAEKAGFSQSEQIALLHDFAPDALKVDLATEQTLQDKNVLLYLIAGTKQRHQQNIIEVDDLSYRVIAKYVADRGATVDDEVPEGHRFYEYNFDYRSVTRTLTMNLDLDRAQLVIYDNAPDPYRSFRPQPLNR